MGRGCGATRAPVASGSGTDLWPSEQGVSAPEVGRRHVRHAVRDACGAEDKVTDAGAEWETEHGVCRAHQPDARAERGSAGAANLVNCPASTASAPGSGLEAVLLTYLGSPR